MKNLRFDGLIAVVAVILLFLGVNGLLDGQDEQDSAAFYAEMVCNGYWPDYKKQGIDCD